MGQSRQVPFSHYLIHGCVPVLAGFQAVPIVLVFQMRGKWSQTMEVPRMEAPPFHLRRSAKGLPIKGIIVFVFCFLLTHWQDECPKKPFFPGQISAISRVPLTPVGAARTFPHCLFCGGSQK